MTLISALRRTHFIHAQFGSFFRTYSAELGTELRSKTQAPRSQTLSSRLPSTLSGQFEFPPGTLHFALSANLARKDFGLYRGALEQHGVLSIQLGFSDPASSFMEEIVGAVGVPATHSATEGALWDVKFKPEGVRSDANEKGGNAIAVSHTLDEFVWHTDAAYEDHPPRFFGFHIIHPDNMGGGVFRVAPVADILAHMDPATCETLRTYPYRMKVPPEFYRSKSHHASPLIDEGLDPNHSRNDLIRYRGDIIEIPPEEHAEARIALQELKELLSNSAVGFDIPKYAFRENSILLLDNARFLHMRTPIKDPRRWLRRIRFHPSWIESTQTRLESS